MRYTKRKILIHTKNKRSQNIYNRCRSCSLWYIQHTKSWVEILSRYGKEFKTKEEGYKFIQDYKIKWETGSNNTTEEVRDQKLDELLDK